MLYLLWQLRSAEIETRNVEEMMQLKQVRAALGIVSGDRIVCFSVGVPEIQYVYFILVFISMYTHY